MNNVKNKEIPTNTILGGVCWIPSAFRKNDRIMTVREKEGLTGYAINPARDLGPRLAHAVLPIKGKGDSNFGYGLVVPIIGPIIGAIAAVLLYGAIPW